jgi:tetratricopeptide (TPR) repeat protein
MRHSLTLAFALAAPVLATRSLNAQHHELPISEKPVALLQGMGIWRHPIATRSPEAQKFFDQGLALLYGFNRYEALRSFRKASELDPRAAMPFWGIAMAQGPYINMDMDPPAMKESCEAVTAGLRLQDADPAGRAWLNAAATRCPDFADPGRYVAAMRELAACNPDDPDAQTLFAEALLLPVRWHWYNHEGQPAAGVAEAERVLEAVLRRFPNHPGANHFYVHAVESSPTPERAIASAQRLMGIVPGAGHMVHMPGHIWLVLGDFNNTVAVNERAVEVDRKYFAATGVSGSYFMYYLHNLQFLLYARAMQGRTAETNEAVRQTSEALEQMKATMPEMAEMFAVFVSEAQLRMNRWDDVLRTPQPKSGSPVSMALWRFPRALAFAGKGQFGEAAAEQAEFESLRPKLPRDMPWDTNKLGDAMDLAALVISSRLERSPGAAVAKWQKAVELEDALVYDEPPAWYYPIRESLGATLLLSGDAAHAESVFREGLRRSPNNGRMLFGLLESLKAQKKDIAWVQAEFDAAWKGADLGLRLKDL